MYWHANKTLAIRESSILVHGSLFGICLLIVHATDDSKRYSRGGISNTTAIIMAAAADGTASQTKIAVNQSGSDVVPLNNISTLGRSIFSECLLSHIAITCKLAARDFLGRHTRKI